ncbi:MAG: PIN domain nuclease [Hyphomicrobium sp.]|nr:PIN domain nuclease [Hyphomicrobium sp.]
MKVLLDTHALLWWVLGNPRLSIGAATVLGAPATTIVISAVSGHEIASKFRLGKLPVPARLAEGLDQMVTDNGWQPLALSIAHAQLAGRLPGHHKDPFDRMLAAQALIEDVPIATNDAALADFGVKVIW